MYDLLQYGRIAHERLKMHQEKHIYQPIKLASRLCTHKSIPISLTLIVDDFVCVCVCVFSVSGPGRHAQIMRRCGLEQIRCSNLVPTSDSGQSSPRLWVPNRYTLSPTRQSNTHAND